MSQDNAVRYNLKKWDSWDIYLGCNTVQEPDNKYVAILTTVLHHYTDNVLLHSMANCIHGNLLQSVAI
jgi:hypothetical protein